MSWLKVLSVVGLPQVDGWAHVVDVDTPQQKFVCSFSVAGYNARNIGRDIAQQLQSNAPKSSEELYNLMHLLTKQVYTQRCSLDVAAVLFSGNRMSLATIRGQVFLRRNSKSGILLRSSNQVRLIEGKRHTDDILMIATEQGSRYFGEVEQRLDQGYDIDSAVTSVSPAVQSYDDSSLSSLAVVADNDQQINPTVYTNQETAKETSGWFGRKRTPQPPAALIPEEQPSVFKTPINLDDEDTTESLSSTGRLMDPTTAETTQPASSPADDQQSQKILEENEVENVSVFSAISSSISHLGTSIAQLFRKPTGEKHEKMHRSTESDSSTNESYRRDELETLPSLVMDSVDDHELHQHESETAFAVTDQASQQKVKKKLTRVILLVLLIGILGLGTATFVYYKNLQQKKLAEEKLTPFTESLKSIRVQAETNPIAARTELVVLVQQLEALEKDVADKKTAAKLVNETLSESRELLQAVSGRQELMELPVFFDLRTVTSNFIATLVTNSGTQAVFFDQGLNQAIILDLQTKQTKTVSVNQLTNVMNIAAIDNSLFFLSSEGISSISLTGESTVKTHIESTPELEQGTLLNTFATYIYVLNPQRRALYRYIEKDGSYSKAVQWLQSPLGVPFDSVVSVVVDGSVWIATKDGTIKKFTSGTADEFVITGLDKPFSTINQLVTGDNLVNLYVFDAEENRVVVLDKNGQYKQEYKSVSLGGVHKIIVSESQGKIFALSGSSMYEINL